VPERPYSLPAADLAHVVEHAGADVWEALRGGRVLVTGGTGFFGRWLVESLAYASEALGLGATAVVVTRDPARAMARAGRDALPPGVRYVAGDVRDFAPPPGTFDWCIHAATEASAKLNAEAPDEMIATTVDGTRRVLAVARRHPLKGLLLCSSGAVYGRQPPSLARVGEEYLGGPDVTDPGQAYAEGKRLAELLGAVAARGGTPVKVARCFAFVGPWLPLDAHFAVGNFIRDRLAGAPIALSGDGTAVRSYLYAADLAVWLWTILVRGAVARPYNVGAEAPVSIYDLARLVAGGAPAPLAVERGREPAPGVAPERYVPATARARTELGLRERVGLADAIERTVRWHASSGAPGRAVAA
jgi:dTDP-glucose 4,6-dehydratase